MYTFETADYGWNGYLSSKSEPQVNVNSGCRAMYLPVDGGAPGLPLTGVRTPSAVAVRPKVGEYVCQPAGARQFP